MIRMLLFFFILAAIYTMIICGALQINSFVLWMIQSADLFDEETFLENLKIAGLIGLVLSLLVTCRFINNGKFN